MKSDKIAILPNHWIATAPFHQAGKSLDDISKKSQQGKPLIKLSSNENPLGGTTRLLSLYEKDPAIDIGRYPDDSYTELRQALASHLGVCVEQLLIGSGSSDILTIIARTFLSAGRTAVVSSYSFPLFKIIATTVNASVEVIESNCYHHDMKRLAQLSLDSSKVLFLDNPCNPTGTYLSHQQMLELLQAIDGRALVVVDEAYFEYVTQDDYKSCIDFITNFNNVVVVRTFSKAYGLAGLRLGYCIAHPSVISVLNKLRQPFNLNAIAAKVGLAALEDQAFIIKSRQTNAQERAKLIHSDIVQQYTVSVNTGNFLFLNLGKQCEQVVNFLNEQMIMVKEFAEYPEHIRITLGLPSENDVLLAALQTVLSY